MTLTKYKVTVDFESNDGEQFSKTIIRHFPTSKDVQRYAAGFADGLAIGCDGAVLSCTTLPVN
jgi:hypothetical protein